MIPERARRRRQASGQSFIETTLLVMGVTIALVIFSGFVRNSVAFRIKSGADTFGQGMTYDGRWP